MQLRNIGRAKCIVCPTNLTIIERATVIYLLLRSRAPGVMCVIIKRQFWPVSYFSSLSFRQQYKRTINEQSTRYTTEYTTVKKQIFSLTENTQHQQVH